MVFPSAYGEYTLDFEDGASCHMLNGGTTRMGKTCLLLYLSTTIFLQQKGNMKLYISSAKLKDYYPFENIPQVQMAMDEEGMLEILNEIIEEYQKRNQLLYSSELQKATDAKSVRKLYPSFYHLFQPIFLVIDEYARFAENRFIQRMVTEIVETAGFVNVHVIIASQRPDAQTVLKPRIRANLLVKMAFTTRDRKNSEVILDIEGAEKLGKIAGRAILIDGDTTIVQVPYLDVTECDRLLEPYRGEKKDEQNRERHINHQVTDKIQSMLSESISLPELQPKLKPNQRSESSIETYEFDWNHSASTTGKG